MHDLIPVKAREESSLAETEFESHDAIIATLRSRLEAGFQASTLPSEPVRARDLDEFLLRLRTSLP